MKSDLKERQTQKKWYAVYTCPRSEKRVNKMLLEMGIEAFLPMHKILRQWSDRKKMVEVPLFTSYVFVNIEPKEYDTVLQTEGVVKYIAFEGKAVAIPQEQINNLLLIINSDTKIEKSKRSFNPGQLVEVSMGSLKGLKGELIKVGGKSRVLIRIDHLHQNLLVNIHANYLH